VAVVEHARFLAQAAAVGAQRAQRMGLVDQHVGTIFLADLDEFLERGAVAQHGVDALQHDQPVARLVAPCLSLNRRRRTSRLAGSLCLKRDDLGLGHLAAS